MDNKLLFLIVLILFIIYLFCQNKSENLSLTYDQSVCIDKCRKEEGKTLQECEKVCI